MEQHPVPQHIAAFEFKLFGNLTARQFITLLPPLSIAILIYFSNMPVILRLPLSACVGIFGFFIALVQIGGRPFDKWIIAFIKAVSAPTQRVWVKEKKIPEFLSVVTTPPQKELKIPQEVTQKGRERMMAYLKSLPKEDVTNLDIKEQLALDRLGFPTGEYPEGNLPPAILWPSTTDENTYVAIGQGESGYLLGSLPQVNGPFETSSENQTAPVLEPEPRPQIKSQTRGTITPGTNRVKIQPQAKPYTISGIEQRLEQHRPQEIIDLARPGAHLASETNYSLDNVIPIKISAGQVRLVHGVGSTRVRKLHFAPPANFDLSKLPIRGERKFDISNELKRRFHFDDNAPQVVLPIESQKIEAAPPPPPVAEKPKPLPQTPPPNYSHTQHAKLATNAQTQQKASSQEFSNFSISDKDQSQSNATAAQQAHIIPLTDKPNILSGLVTDEKGIPIESAVLVIRDEGGIPVRALKTNKLGQFLSATPLSSGTYSIEAESDRAAFKPLSFKLSGQIMAPIDIKGERVN